MGKLEREHEPRLDRMMSSSEKGPCPEGPAGGSGGEIDA